MTIDLEKLNSMTKYPSILTFHELAENKKHGLKNEVIPTSSFDEEESVYLYEKIDGENARIILVSDGENIDYFIGSRKELLHAKGDRISIPTGNIANYFKPIAKELEERIKGKKGVLVIYFESYGGTLPKAKQYTNDKSQYGRVFDAFRLSLDQFYELLKKEKHEIASWRDNGGQPYLSCSEREALIEDLGLTAAPLLGKIKGKDIPTDVLETRSWMEPFKETKVGINHNGSSEGVIARTHDRKKIAKIRFEDYNKTLRAQQHSKT